MTVMRLRKLLRRDYALRLDAGRVGLDPGCVWVDAFAFEHGTIRQIPFDDTGTGRICALTYRLANGTARLRRQG